MYVPAFSAVNDEEQARPWSATSPAPGSSPPPRRALRRNLMPILWHEDRVIAHMVKANLHRRTTPTAPPA